MSIVDTTTVSSHDPAHGAGVESPFATADLYRDIHKAIRVELFALVGAVGSFDPADPRDVEAVIGHVASVRALLDSHAHHEDSVIGPQIDRHLPRIAERIAVEHATFDRRVERLDEQASSLRDVSPRERDIRARELYLDLSRFVGVYLEHQDVEERQVMPALERAIGIDAVHALHGAIVSSIPPDEMTRSLAVMFPAMNPAERVEMLEGMRAEAPPEVYAGVLSLARSVLTPNDFAVVTDRLGARPVTGR